MNQQTLFDLDLIESLLDLPGLAEQSALLREARLLDADGLFQLLDWAEQLARSDPAQARRLAAICAGVVDSAAAPAARPRAAYIRAQTHAINAEFETALELIEAAREGYIALGDELEALRTNVGLMSVLNELGRHQEALAAGQTVINALDSIDDVNARPAPSEAGLLAALVYQNCGIAYELIGRYEEALSAYATAEEHYLALEMTERLGDISNNRGIVLLNLGRGSEALAAFEAAAAIRAEAGLTLQHAETLINIGDAHLLLGNYTRSLDAFGQARRLFEALDALADEHVLLLDTAEAYLALNLYPEALAAYRQAAGQLQNAGMLPDRARALWGTGMALFAQEQFEEAGRALAEAATLFAATDNVPLLCNVMLEQAALLAARGQPGEAQAIAHQTLALSAGNDWPVQHIYAHMRLADLLLPDAAAAEPHLLEAQRVAETLALPHLRYRLNRRLGQARRLQGRNREAQALLERAVDDVEWLRGTLAQEAMRTSFLRDKTAVYEELVQLHLDRDDDVGLRRAFNTAERAKSRTLVDLIGGGIEPRPSRQTGTGMGARLQALQADLNVVYNELLGPRDGGQAGARLPDLRKRAAELEQEISQLRLQSAAVSPVSDPFGTPLSLEAVQDQLPLDVILLTYYICGDEIMAFVSFLGQVRVVRHLSTVTEVQPLLQRLALQWDRFRTGQDFVGRHMARLEQSARRLLALLHARLVAPLESVLAEAVGPSPATLPDQAGPAPKLVIVPHGPLHQVPFHALFDGEQYLLERFEISYAPSATVLALCQDRKPRCSDKALVMGITDPRIPAVAAEARTVARRIAGATVCVDEQATQARLRAEVPGCTILHLACHGLFRADNPMFSALKLHDGWLLAADVAQLDLAGALVTLSACETGRSQVIAGDEIIGLVRAFLGAGAATLVVSLWLVQDETTAALMATWYEQLLGGQRPAAALRAAQLALKAQHAHPYYWAPFVLVGRQ